MSFIYLFHPAYAV